MKADELERASAPADRTAIDRAMGNELRMREAARDVWVPPSIDALRQDLRDACRLIVRRPLLTLPAIGALVVGIAASAMAFALLDALMFRPLPVHHPESLVYLRDPSFSYPQLAAVRSRSTFLDNAFFWNLTPYDTAWSGDAEPEPTLVLLASGSMHATLGVPPMVGRLLSPQDEGAPSGGDAAPVGVLSYGAWQRRFGGDAAAIGQRVRIQGVPITIVGVTPRQFFGVAPGRAPEITVPLTLAARLRPSERDILANTGRAWLHFMGRLRSGITREEADARLQTIWPHVLEETTERGGSPERRARFLARRTALVSGATGFSSVRNQFAQPVLVLSALAGLLLLVGCATVANLLLAGAWGRSRELAVRLALGCGRARLARQLFIEGLVLSSIAGALSLLLAKWTGTATIAMLGTAQDPVALDAMIDARAVLFTIALASFCAIAFSLAPMMMAARIQVGPALKAGSRQASVQGHVAGRTLVAIQIAISVVLLVGAALFLESLRRVLSVHPGFESDGVLIARLDPPAPAAGVPDEVATLARGVNDAIARTGEVESVALSLYPPISDRNGSWTQNIGVGGDAPAQQSATTFFNAVSPGYFGTLRTQVTAGRDFTWEDGAGAARVAIVSESLARRYFPGGAALGRRISIGLDVRRRDLLIVGVVANAKYQRVQEDTRDIAYLPLLQEPEVLSGNTLFASVRVVQVSEFVRERVRAAISAADVRLSPRVELLSTRIRESIVIERVLATIGAGLAAGALFLASSGLFALMTHLVARRTREIGVRLALGARPAAVLGAVLGEALALAAVGIALGLGFALLVARWIAGVLYGVSPHEPWAYAGVAVMTMVLAAGAGLLPARRAAAVDPIEALRAD